MTPSQGPHMPTSVWKAVPPGRTRSSEVCTWVCVPSTAETRGVVAGGEQIETRLEQLVRALGGDAGATRGVLRVADAKVEAVPLAQEGHEVPHRLAAGLSHDVADEEDLHPDTITKRDSVHNASTRRSFAPEGTSSTTRRSKTSATLRPAKAASVAS